MKVAVVFGTYNRRPLLERAVESIRQTSAGVEMTMVVVDGGSTDGSRAWLAEQPDVYLIADRGPRDGAVRAFNFGFRHALEAGFDLIGHFNDDAECVDPGMWRQAADALAVDDRAAAAAFLFDLRGPYNHETCCAGLPYSNFGLMRATAMREVARAQGDPTGTALWNPIYRTYGADSEVGCWMWRLGWRVLRHAGRVHDLKCKDALREANTNGQTDSKLYWSRWPDLAAVQPWSGWQGRRVHLGCGTHRLAGWLNVDGRPGRAVDRVMDIERDLSLVQDDVVDAVYWGHGPEHVHPDKLLAVLRHIRRILRNPGGEILLAAPDLVGVYENRYLSAANGSAWASALFGETRSTDHPYLSHKQVFTQESLAGLLVEAGFRDVGPWRTEDRPEIHALNDYARSCALVTAFARGVR